MTNSTTDGKCELMPDCCASCFHAEECEYITIQPECKSCRFFKRNKPNTPIFIGGLWWGGPDAGLCKRESEHYDADQHVVDTDGCGHWEAEV
jgi:hypothetical protein